MDFQYVIQPFSPTPTFRINKHIGSDKEDGQGIDGAVFAKEVEIVDAAMPRIITFYTNSMGGCVRNGLEVFSSIAACNSTTKSIIAGFAYSTAGWIPLAADEVEVYDYSSWMCHPPYDPKKPESVTPFVNAAFSTIATVIAQKSGRNGKDKKTVDEVKAMMVNQTYYTAQELYDNGLVDRILSSETGYAINVEEDLVPQYQQHQVIFNKYFETTEKEDIMAFPKVANKLNIAENSGEDEMLAGIAKIENRALKAENDAKDAKEAFELANKALIEARNKVDETKTAMDKVEAEKKAANDEVAAMNTKQEAVNKELEQLRADKLEADNKAKEIAELAATDAAEALVNQFSSKIGDKEEVINGWKDLAVKDYKQAKLLLETMPTNVKAPIANVIDPNKAVTHEEGSFGALFNEAISEAK